jgi:hypothetical protein
VCIPMVVVHLFLAFTFPSLLTVICRSGTYLFEYTLLPSCSPSGTGSYVTILLWFQLLHYICSPRRVCRIYCVFSPSYGVVFIGPAVLVVVVVVPCDVPGMVDVGCCVWYLAMFSDQLLLCGSVLCGRRWVIVCGTLRCIRIRCY